VSIISERRKNRVETPPIVSNSQPLQRRAETAIVPGHPFRSTQQNFHAVDFCIWQRALLRSRPYRGSQGRKPIRPDQCA
jgi:hypothetical protein